MIRTAGLLLTALVLSACGAESTDRATPTDQPSSGPTEPTIIGVYSATAAGGAGGGPVADIADPDAQAALLDPIDDPLRAQVLKAINDTMVPEGERLVGGIVSIDCAAPETATLDDKGDGLVFTPVWATKPPPECFAPVTAIALALVPDGWTGSAGS